MRALLVAGLAWGDEGKGATVDFLTKEMHADLIVRYNGGSQAGHNVVTPDGRHHCFQQFGSGMFHVWARTHLSQFMLVNPINMMKEEEHLREVGILNAWSRTTVDPRALIITPFHRELNRIRAVHHGFENTCGQGVGVCREFHLKFGKNALFAGDMKNETTVRAKLRIARDACAQIARMNQWALTNVLREEETFDWCWEWYKLWPARVNCMPLFATAIFEGAQGVLLDETHGEPEFNTWTDCTFQNAKALLPVGTKTTRIGVIRTYATRHGAGPMRTEDHTLTYPEAHNEDTGFQGCFRRGRFDSDAFESGVSILGGIDTLAVNHTDVVPWPARKLDIPVIRGSGPTYKDRRME